MAEPAAVQSRVCGLLQCEPPRWVLLVLLCAVLFVRGRVLKSADTSDLFADPDGYFAVAENLVRDFTFGLGPDRHWHEPLPTASRAPLYPVVLAVLSLLDEGPSLFILFHFVLGAATVVCTWRLGRSWGLPPGGALAAAGLVAVDPILLAHSTQVMTETLATFLATLTLLVVIRGARSDSLRWSLAAGALLGLCILCRPEFLAWAALVVVAFPYFALGERRWWRATASAVAIAVVLAPWAIRNQLQFGVPVVTTTHGGYTLLLANNPSFYEYARSGAWGSVWNGDAIYRECELIREEAMQLHKPPPTFRLTVDEVAADREAYHRAFQNIRAEPGGFLWSCVVRVGRLWNVLPHATSTDESSTRRGLRWSVAVWYAFELTLAAAGAWHLRKRLWREPWLWGVLLVLAVTAVHVFYWTDMRMRAPLSPVIALSAAAGLFSLACGKQAASAVEPAA